MTISTPTHDKRARAASLLALRGSIASHSANLSVLAASLADIYILTPHDRGAVDALAGASASCIHLLDAFLSAERALAGV